MRMKTNDPKNRLYFTHGEYKFLICQKYHAKSTVK